MEPDDEFIKCERRRSERIVTSVYAVMALVFAMTSIIIAHCHTSFGMKVETAMFLAKSFAVLAAGNIIIVEVWQNVYAHRSGTSNR